MWWKLARTAVRIALRLAQRLVLMLAEYARALELIFGEEDKEAHNLAHARANELLDEAEQFFAPQEASLPPAGRRHNTYVWRLLLLDDAQRAGETACEKLARIGYGGSGDARVFQHHNAVATAAERQERGEDVSNDAQNSNCKRALQPDARNRFFIETPPDTRGEWRIYENVSELKARFGERCVLTALRESSQCSNRISTRPHCRQRAAHGQWSPRLRLQNTGGPQMD